MHRAIAVECHYQIVPFSSRLLQVVLNVPHTGDRSGQSRGQFDLQPSASPRRFQKALPGNRSFASVSIDDKAVISSALSTVVVPTLPITSPAQGCELNHLLKLGSRSCCCSNRRDYSLSRSRYVKYLPASRWEAPGTLPNVIELRALLGACPVSVVQFNVLGSRFHAWKEK